MDPRIRILLVTLMGIRIRLPNKKAQNLEKVLKEACIPYILACHLQIDPDPDPAHHFDADADPTFNATKRFVVTKVLFFTRNIFQGKIMK